MTMDAQNLGGVHRLSAPMTQPSIPAADADKPLSPEHNNVGDTTESELRQSIAEPTQPKPSEVTRDNIHQHFEPYRRISPPWTLSERISTFLMAIFVLPFRFLFLVIAGAFVALLSSIALIGVKSPDESQQTQSENQSEPPTEPSADYSDPFLQPLPSWRKAVVFLIFPIVRAMLFVSFGVFRVQKSSREFSEAAAKRMPPSPSRAYVIVSNHLGYIDILVILAAFRSSFVAKGECEHTPIIGLIARALQCMFVRPGQSLTTQLVNRVQSTYACHDLRRTCPGCPACLFSLVIFPEGTTTNGTAMIPFRTGVFNAGHPVQPVCIRFPYRRFNLSWETISMREHVFRTMTQPWNNVECIRLPVYVPTQQEQSDARLFAANVQSEIAGILEQPIVPLNRKHKLLYHSFLLGKEENEASVLQKAAEITRYDQQLHYVENGDLSPV